MDTLDIITIMHSKLKLLSIFISIFFFLVSCKNTNKNSNKNKILINYLDEYVIYNDTIFNESKIGGLSGIDYSKDDKFYYLVCDDAKKPRYYKASILLDNNQFNSVEINEVVELKDTIRQFLNNNIIDLEAIRTFGKNKLIFASEGSIKNDYNPSIFITDPYGNYSESFSLPTYFLTDTNSRNKPRHNGVFEGLAADITNDGYWAAMELPLELDGKEPTFNHSGAPVRITHFSTKTNQADFQFTYPLDKLTKDPKGNFGVNGITCLLQLSQNEFIVIERAYSEGYGTQGNTVKIYLANIEHTTNTLPFDTLQNKEYKVAKKELLFDFETVRSQLTNNILDNIEGITLGPILENGNQSLILVADNNFSPVSKQINQLILLELVKP
ncbi:esterase-like activity of phytase family protein [uncultured Aquimarina sp.]|uniref:esterase-like activity of phytase family protein n=1 Tax=uncultured Aquimarina sp. TaxID=575652 RepID=UPI002611D567|nr:esterase-like activity of phytase family protein [uncultured Aquimarina sp.]